MSKRHKIPSDRLVAIPMYLTPMRPVRGEFNQYTTRAPYDLWNAPTLKAVASHSFCPIDRAAAAAEIERRAGS